MGAPQPAAPWGARPTVTIKLGTILVAAGALLMFLFSFAPFVQYADQALVRDLKKENLPTWFSAWGLETFMAPLSWWVPLSALALVALAVLRFWIPRDREFVGFRTSQVQVGLALFGFLILVGYALSAKTLIFGSELQDEISLFAEPFDSGMTFAWGGVLMLLASIVAVTGAVLDHLDIGPVVWPLPQRPTQPGYPAAGGYQPGYPQQYPQGQPGYPQQYPQTQGYPPSEPTFAPGQATIPPGGYQQPGGYR